MDIFFKKVILRPLCFGARETLLDFRQKLCDVHLETGWYDDLLWSGDGKPRAALLSPNFRDVSPKKQQKASG